MKNRIILIAAALMVVSGCGLLKKYKDTQEAPENLYGTDEVVNFALDTVSIADISWRDYFTDPILLNLIDSVLVNNVDMNRAKRGLQQAELALKASKLNFLPNLYFSPYIKSENSANNYVLPFSAEWSTPGFGSLINNKRMSQSSKELAADVEQAVRSSLVSETAIAYHQLQLLDRRLQIMEETELVWQDVLETQRALMENGKAYSTSVNQMEASLMDIKIQKINAQEAVKNAEYAICLMLSKAPCKVERNSWGSYSLPKKINAGIPASLLSKRPDVRAAEREVEVAYYTNKKALAAMFPSITLSGLIGWTNGGRIITDPIQMIYNAIGSLAQPLFARGQLKSQYEITKISQQQAADDYVQKIVEAGNEVNTALRDCQSIAEKDVYYKHEVDRLRLTWSGTIELMKNGKASYVEVLMAQDALLKAELAEADNMFSGKKCLIELYYALGGGVN